jgi:hypothetical protein
MFYSQEQYNEYQEDLWGDGYSNEYQRVAAQQLLERPLRNETLRARELTIEGKFVVLVSFPRYCRFTDGLLGQETVIEKIFDTDAQAQDWVAGYAADYYDADDARHWLYPQVAFGPAKPLFLDEIDDEIPF